MTTIPQTATELLGERLVALYTYRTMFVDGPRAPSQRWLALVDALDASVLAASCDLHAAVEEAGGSLQVDTVADVRNGADVFPVFLLELLDTRELVAGDDALASLELDLAHLRAAIERGMRVVHRQLLAGYLAAESGAPLARTLRAHVRKAVYLLRALAELRGLALVHPVAPSNVVDVVTSALLPDDTAAWRRLAAFANYEATIEMDALRPLCASLLAVLGRAVDHVDGCDGVVTAASLTKKPGSLA